MELLGITLLTGTLLVVTGAFFLFGKTSFREKIFLLPRSHTLSIILMTIGTSWFLYRHVMNLSEADFGDYKVHIVLITLFIFFSSFVFTRDFLAVRGASIVLLLYSREILDAAFLQEPSSRLVLVSITYLFICAALYFGAWPYRIRDFLEYLYAKSKRVNILGSCFVIGGVALFIATSQY